MNTVLIEPDSPKLGVLQGKLPMRSLQDDPSKSMILRAGMKVVGTIITIEE